MAVEIEVTQPDGSSETPELETLENPEPETPTPENPPAAAEAAPPAAEDTSDEVTITIDGEEEPEPEPERAPEWVRELRKSHRELQRKVREYEAKGQNPVTLTQQMPGAKPRLEDHDYDTDKYEAALESWYKQKDAFETAKREQQRQMEEQQRSWQAKLDSYAKAKTELKVKDFEDIEAVVQDAFNTTQQGIILQGAENPAMVVYALGKNAKKAKSLAEISDPVKFAFAVAKLESQLKVQPRKTAPPPERTAPSGNAPISGSTDATLDRLRAEAERTGDMTKVIRYKQQQREKQSARR